MEQTVKCENITEETVHQYEQKGYELVFLEHVMEHDLTEIPQLESSLPLTFQSWSSSSEEDFYDVYAASFKDRPGFPGWSMEKWIDWISSSSTFLPVRSYLATVHNKAIGFIAADADEEFSTEKGFIIQVGVIPEWRRKGIAAQLTCSCLEAFRQDGKRSVVLHVNENNPGAIGLYEELGFRTVRKRGTFERL
ncbi:GNAT family N-acetyltransferase [Alkalihalobacillus sp. R86527]|uniref:GNAT family N-acetyltransferase n=1 Tax=Alkalihalobacillus sp. R86527 TaxID=3093863 RepID=UPI003671A4BE